MAQLLIIDDDKDTGVYLKEFFEQRKCSVSTVHSGAEGLEYLKKHKPDLILLDVRMEGLNGLETLKAIKELKPALKVIIMTVASDEETRRQALALGADDFIKKPFHTANLEGAVSSKVAALVRERKPKR